jgi:hypothetical protein
MAVVVNLWSKKVGEIKKFLERYYEKEVRMDEDVEQWTYVYNKPLDSIDIISAVMDNSDIFQVAIYIQIDKCDICPVTAENYNDIIKGLLSLFYIEPIEATC